MTTLFLNSDHSRQQPLLRAMSILVAALLCLGVFSSTVSATTTYIICDGEQTTTLVDNENADVTALLAQAGISAADSDVSLSQTENGAAQITIHRSLSAPAAESEAFEDAEDEAAEAAQWEQVPAVSTVQVSTITVPYGTETRKTDTLLLGETKILTPGHDGLRTLREEVTWAEDGSELSRTTLCSTLTIAPVTEIILEGTAQPEPEPEPEPAPLPENAIVTASGEILTYSQVLSCEATAYTCEGCSWNITATGTVAHVGEIAVDPTVIPLGSRLYVLADDGYCVYGVCTAEDTGGAIKGNRIDLYYDTYVECINFGRRQCTVYVLD